jgi:hypothetical protein
MKFNTLFDKAKSEYYNYCNEHWRRSGGGGQALVHFTNIQPEEERVE